ncbi:MAG: A/G-specific adenine glycosylase [Lysobacteraceae bacterium]|nr:MAG: A/G-specific adenine glycosylase [Xanthomonadaceae bacterium]
MPPTDFAPRLLAWFEDHGRRDLPWQHPRTPYRTWLAEVMLQQTRVETVIPYFQRFVQALPELPDLAAASEERVLALWSGLGYYRRARQLHAAARLCMERHHGRLPEQHEALAALPGIGRSTAAAIRAQAFGQPDPILDGNVRRVLCRLHGIEGWPGRREVENRLWELAARLMPAQRCADYTQALMDFGATWCSRAMPRCKACPFASDCVAWTTGRVETLPTPRPARPLPQRRCLMLVLRDASGKILLQRRDRPGVWQGLWSLPEFASKAAMERFAQALGAASKARRLAPLQHAFSHYRLRIQPYLQAVPAAPARIGDNPALRWTAPAELPDTGLPAPVRRLLDQLEEAS